MAFSMTSDSLIGTLLTQVDTVYQHCLRGCKHQTKPVKQQVFPFYFTCTITHRKVFVHQYQLGTDEEFSDLRNVRVLFSLKLTNGKQAVHTS